MKLSVITVSWNSDQTIAEQIRSVVFACRNSEFEQILIDNASSDQTVAIIKTGFPRVTLIANEKNMGFAHANNQGVALAKGEYLLFLNPDMRMLPNHLDRFIEWMDVHPDVGIASCKLINKDGNFNENAKPRRFPKIGEQVALVFKLPHLFPSLFKNYFYHDFNPNDEQEVDSLRGSLMMMRKSFVEKLGFAFDPRYFIWFEDVDICREAHRLGYKVMYTPKFQCVDYVGQSFRQRPSYWKQKHFTKSMLQYFQKWEPWYKWIWIALVRPVGLVLVWINETFMKLTGFDMKSLSRLEKKAHEPSK
ncbi:MAG TPA: glycosyltransferase family 2 protein [Patescibacteria group bacterium]|nr:glycosyltransferase family 2 protein [Patescibacteria group bacterium]